MSDTEPLPTQGPPAASPPGSTVAHRDHALAAEAGGPPPDGGTSSITRRLSVVRFHKKGGMGRVFVAIDDRGREIALKDIQPDKYSTTAAELFEFEANVTADLEHPGVIPVYGRGWGADGRPFYAMRFVDGPTLTAAIVQFHNTFPEDKPKASLTAEQTVELRQLLGRFLAVCQTVAYAHSRGVLHRDLKPGNVLLGPFGETLVIDWGLAKRLTAPEPEAEPGDEPPSVAPGGFDPWEVSRRVKGKGSGTPGYWSPEQAAGRTTMHDQRTDVYSLGAVLFHILTGTSPHPSGLHVGPVPSTKTDAEWVDDELDGIARKALSRKRRDRFQTATELATAVERWLADQPTAAQRATVAALRKRVAGRPGDVKWSELLARQCANLGLILVGMGRYEDSLGTLGEAVTLYDDLHRRQRDKRFQAEVANCHMAAAQALAKLGRMTEAGDRRGQAVDIYRGLFREQPGSSPDFTSTFAALPDYLPRSKPGLSGLAETSFVLPALVSDLPDDDFPAAHGPESLPGFSNAVPTGTGVFGQIWKATDPAGRGVSVSVLDVSGGTKDVRAYKLLRLLDHPHLLPVLSVRLTDRAGRAVEYGHADRAAELTVVHPAAEGTLAEMVKASGRRAFPAAEVLDLLDGPAAGLDYLNAADHGAGADDGTIVHCDVKPPTLFLLGGAVRVGRFDVAVRVPGDVRRPGGTVAYSPPELLANKPGVGTDQYSLAITYFELRTGKFPFPAGVTAWEVMTLHAEGRLDFGHPSLTAGEVTALQRATAIKPGKRFASCRKFLKAMRTAVE